MPCPRRWRCLLPPEDAARTGALKPLTSVLALLQDVEEDSRKEEFEEKTVARLQGELDDATQGLLHASLCALGFDPERGGYAGAHQPPKPHRHGHGQQWEPHQHGHDQHSSCPPGCFRALAVIR